MSEKDINRWKATIAPNDKAPQPWTMGSGGSWDMLEVQPIPDAMMAELAQLQHYQGTPWNCRSMPLSERDREFMYLLHYSAMGLVARMRQGEKRVDELAAIVRRLAHSLKNAKPDSDLPTRAMDYLKKNGIQGSPLRDTP